MDAFVDFIEMADEALFDFLHMEIVSHVYKHSSKGEIDNKVSKTVNETGACEFRGYAVN